MSSQAAPETAVTAPRRSVSRGLLKSASDLLGLSGSRRAPARKFGALSSLRGHSGAAFEGEAKIARDVPLCLCCASSQPAHLLVKGCHLFAFARSPEDDATPKYAIPLDGLAASVETAGAGTPARTVVVYKKLHGGAESRGPGGTRPFEDGPRARRSRYRPLWRAATGDRAARP